MGSRAEIGILRVITLWFLAISQFLETVWAPLKAEAECSKIPRKLIKYSYKTRLFSVVHIMHDNLVTVLVT